MLKLSKLSSNSHVLYFFGEILSKGMFFILLPFLGRTISVSEFGVFSLLFPFIQNLLPTASFGLSNSLFRYYFEKDVSKESLFSSTLISWFILAIIGYPVFYLVMHSTSISEYQLYKYHFSNFVTPLLISLLCLGFSQILTESFRVQKKVSLFILLNLSSRFIIVLAVIIAVYFGFLSSIQLLWSIAIGTSVVFVYSLFIYIFNLKISVDWSLIKKLIHFGYPVMMTPLSVLLLYVGNRYVLNDLVSSEEVGVYSMAVSLVQVVALIPATFSRAWVPELFSRLRDGCASTDFFRKIISYYMFIFIFFCFSVEVSSRSILLVVGGEKYLAALSLFPILLSGFILEAYYTFSIDRLYYAKRVSIVITLTTISGVFNVIATYIAVTYWGMIGAAFSFALSMFLQASLFAVCANRIDKIVLPYKQLLRYVSIGITGSTLIWYALSLEIWGGGFVTYTLMTILLVYLFRQDYTIITQEKLLANTSIYK